MKKGKYFMIAGGVLVIIVIVFLIFWSNSENNGNIGKIDTNKDVLSASKTTEGLDSELFSTLYDSSLQIKSTSIKSSGPIFYQYLLAPETANDESQVAITIGKLDGALNDSSPAKFRVTEREKYIPSSLDFAPADSLVFVSNYNNNYELAVIFSDGNHYAAVVSSGTPARKQSINERLSDIVSSWQWK